MRKRLHILLALFTVALTVMAGPISTDEALAKARAIAAGRGKTVADAGRPAYKAPRKGAVADGASYYVFNFADTGSTADGRGSGFVIIAGDDAVTAGGGLLGMADSGTFDSSSMPANFSDWLDLCAAEVEAVAAGAPAYAPAVHAGIEPLISTKWNQEAPYNNLMPTYTWQGTTRHYYTGCTITAMAQVMNYHRWPQAQTTDIPEHGGQAALATTTFDWDNMKDIYGGADTEAEETAVATLMRYCAQGTKAVCEYYGTAAALQDAAYALKKYFGYGRSATHVTRSMYSIDQWDALIYGELSAGRPVVYAGASSSVGHAFVCDGYRDGLYHINWGWGGYCDGYFRLSVLNPSGSGIGGSTTEDGYSMSQEAIVGIQPSTADGSNETGGQTLVSTSLSVSASYIAFNYINSGSACTFDFGAEAADASGRKTLLWSYSGQVFPAYTGINEWGDFLSRYNLAAGTYTIYPVCRESGRNEWKRCSGPSLYAEATVSADGQITVVEHPVAGLEATAFTMAGNSIATATQEVQVTVKNSGDEVYGTLYLMVKTPAGSKYEQAGMTGIAIEAGGEETVSLFFTPATAGTYGLMVIADNGSSQATIGQTSVAITEAPTEKSDIRLRRDMALVTDMPNTIIASVVNSGTETYLRPLVARLFTDAKDGTGLYRWVEDAVAYQPLEPGATQTFTFTFTNLIEGGAYLVELLSYEYFSDTEPGNSLGYKYFTGPTGIDGVKADAGTDDEPYYTLTGRRIAKPTQKGVYIHRGKKVVVR